MKFNFYSTHKQSLLIVLLATFFPCSLFAQSYAIVGTGTTSYNTVPSPFYNSSWGSRNQYYVKAAELTTSGLSNGSVISSVGFSVDVLNGIGSLQGWNVKVYSTSVTNPLSTDWQTSGLVSYSIPTTLTLTASSWNQTALAYPFIWNGTDNLVIEVCFNNSSTTGAASVFRSTLSGSTFSRHVRGNNLGICSNNSTTGNNAGTSTSIRPNMRFGYSSSSCSGVPIGGTATISDPNPCAGTYISLGLTGASTGNGTGVQWQQSATGTGSWTNVTGASSYYYYYPATGSNYYRAAVSCGANTVYSNTVQLTVPAYLAGGTYTINSGQATNISSGGTNFNNFADFSTAVAYSISGPVVANVTASGTYTQPLIFTIGSTCGTSQTNTITVNGNGATINYVSSDPNQRGAVTINGSNYITINNLKVNGYSTSSSNYCYGFLATNNAGNVTLNNCSVVLDSNSTTTNYAGIVFSGSLTNPLATGSGGNNITLSNDTINGGAYGIVLMSDTTSAHSGWSITGNTIKNVGTYGIYGNAMNTPLIKGNDISRSGRTTMTDFHGIFMENNCLYLKIQSNKIHDVGTGNVSAVFDFYGIKIANSLANSSYKHDVSNNIMYNLTGSGNHYYLYNTNSYNTNYYYNTVASMSTSSLASGITVGYYHDISPNGAYNWFYNNNMVITRKSAYFKELYYIKSGLTRLDADNNNLFVNGQGYNYAANSQDVLINTIFDWMNSAIIDLNSVGMDPIFVNPSIGNLQPTNFNLDNLGKPKPVTTDILGITRDVSYPDIGAYEFSAASCSGSPNAGAAASDVSQACSGGSVYLTVTNAVLNSGLTISWESKPSTGSSWTAISNSSPINYSSYYKATMPSVSTDFRAKFICGASTSYSTPVTVASAPFYRCYCSPNTGVSLHNFNSNIITNISILNMSLNSSSVDGMGTSGYTFNDPVFAYNTTTMARGYSYTVTANLSVTTDTVGMWIDYNQNGVMNTSEYVLMIPTGNTATATITIPNTAVGGYTGMRFRAYYNVMNSGQACVNQTNIQETEDYVVNIYVPQQCNGTPASGTAFGPSSICPNVSFNLSDTAYSLAIGLTFQWQQYNTSTSSWSNISGATNPVYAVTNGITSAMSFRVAVTCTNTSSVSYSNTVAISINAANGCYCTTNLYDASGGCSDNDYIRSFSTWGSTNSITNVNSYCNNSTTGYTYFNTMTHIAKQADTIYWALANTVYDYEAYKIWVDFNHNGSFSDPGEYVYGSSTSLSPSDVDSGYFVIPYNASVGATRIRVKCVYGTTNFTPCSYAYYGETEDYNLQINQNTNICQSAPTVTVTSPYNYFCQDTTVTLSGSTGNNLYYTYQWQTSAAGANTWTAISDATDMTYDVGGFLTATDFRMAATCPYGGAIGYSNVKTISPSIASDDFIVPDTVNAWGTSFVLNVVGSGYSGYLWNTSATTQTISITTDGMYICSVTQGLCAATDSVYAKFATLCQATINAGQDMVVCAGSSITLNATSNGTISWDGGITNGVSFTPSSSGMYIATGTISAGCVAKDTVFVTVNNLPNVSGGNNQTICLGQSVTLTGSGANTYTWNNGITNGISFAPTQTTTYTVTGTALNGCTNTAQTTVTVNNLPNVSGGNNQAICLGQSVTLNGSGANTYTWNNGISNGISFAPTQTTTYTVTGTAINGCTNTAQTTVTVNSLPNVSGGNNQAICLGQSVTLNGSGANTYTWNNGISNGISFAPTQTTTYTVTGTAINGCTNTAQTTVTVNSLPNVSGGNNQAICLGQSVTLTGSGANTYTWNNGISNGISFAPTQTTTYTVTGTALNGCTNTAQTTVTVNSLPNVSGGNNQTICLGQSVTLNGSGANTYTWNNGITNGISFAPTQTTTYTVTGTALNGCTNTAQTTVTVNNSVTINAGNDTSICMGENVVLNAVANAPLIWSDGIVNNQPFTPTITKAYVVTASAGVGCSNSDTVLVTVFSLPQVNAGADVNVCEGDSISLNATGALNYQWSGGIINGISFMPSINNIYLVTGVDLNGCENSDSVQVTVLPKPIAFAGNDKTICPNATVTLTATSGASYLWSNGSTAQSINVSNGNYYVTVTNNDGCSDSSPVVNVSVKAMPSTIKIKYIGSNVVCEPNGVQLAIDLAFGATTGFEYQWNNSGNPIAGAIDSTYYTTSSGAFTLTVSGGNNCIKNSSVKSITVKPLPVASFSANSSTVFCAGGSVLLSAPILNGYTYTWLKDGLSAGSGISKTFKISGNYTVVAKLNGCVDTADTSVIVVVNALPIAYISSSNPLTFCAGDSAALSASPSYIGFNYQWLSGSTVLAATSNSNFTVFSTGTYKVIITDTNSCVSKTSTTNVKIKVNPLPVASITPVGSTTIAANGNVKLNASPSSSVTWQWFKNGVTIPGATTKQLIATTAGNYTVAVNKSGCIGISSPITVVQTGIREVQGTTNNEANFEIAAYPNPVSEKLNFTVRGIDTIDGIIQVIDYKGNLVYTQQIKTASSIIDMNKFAVGTYLIRYKDEAGRTGTLKIIHE